MIEELKNEIKDRREAFDKALADINSSEKLRELREEYTSRKSGLIGRLFSRMKTLPPEERPEAGQRLNRFKQYVETSLEDRASLLKDSGEQSVDATLPAGSMPLGAIHIISSIQSRVENIFIGMGYEIAHGPEVENDYNNFTALNFLENHPARDEQDTFFIEGEQELLLRTHTSPVQIRFMKTHQPPFKIISPGKVFRKDDPDATHTPVFHQVEGLLVDRDITFSHLKGTLQAFAHCYFGSDTRVRFRPGYFPFTEPSAEVDVSCFRCGGSHARCRICKGTGWIEILGSGMVHPQVLINCDINPEIYSGFAFGMGVERIAMLKYGVDDLRRFYDNDLRFLEQFRSI